MAGSSTDEKPFLAPVPSFKSLLAMGQLVFFFFLVTIPFAGVFAEKKEEIALDFDYGGYPPFLVPAATTVHLTCLEDDTKLNQLPRLRYKWYRKVNKTAHHMKFSRNSTDMRLTDRTRTLVIDHMKAADQGKYKCRVMCPVTRVHRVNKKAQNETQTMKKPNRKSRRVKYRKCTRRELRVERVVHKTYLLIEEPIRSGYCDWRKDHLNEVLPDYQREQFHGYCRCYGGDENDCGRNMKLQRRKLTSESWADVEERTLKDGVFYQFTQSAMEITLKASNLTYEASGFYRCVAYDKKGLTCETDEQIYLQSSLSPVPLPAPVYDKEHLWYFGLPILVLASVILIALCIAILYYKFTARIIVKPKHSCLIQKVHDPFSSVLKSPAMKPDAAFV